MALLIKLESQVAKKAKYIAKSFRRVKTMPESGIFETGHLPCSSMSMCHLSVGCSVDFIVCSLVKEGPWALQPTLAPYFGGGLTLETSILCTLEHGWPNVAPSPPSPRATSCLVLIHIPPVVPHKLHITVLTNWHLVFSTLAIYP